MSTDFKTGIGTGLLIYGVGAILTVIVHLIYGWDYAHAPPVSALPIFLTLAIGAFRLLRTLFKAIIEKSKRAKGELFVHCAVAVFVFCFIVWLNIGY